MELEWTGEALNYLARLYEFLAPINQQAAAATIQVLTTAPTMLLANPRLASNCSSPNHVKYDNMRFAMRSRKQAFNFYDNASC